MFAQTNRICELPYVNMRKRGRLRFVEKKDNKFNVNNYTIKKTIILMYNRFNLKGCL